MAVFRMPTLPITFGRGSDYIASHSIIKKAAYAKAAFLICSTSCLTLWQRHARL